MVLSAEDGIMCDGGWRKSEEAWKMVCSCG